MAEHSWPLSVPGPELSSVRHKPAFDNILRSRAGVGMKIRRLATSVPKIMTCRLWLSAAELQTLLDFHGVTLNETAPFDWVDFRKPNDTTTPATYRFRKEPEHGQWTMDSYWVDIELDLLTDLQGTYLLDIEGLST